MTNSSYMKNGKRVVDKICLSCGNSFAANLDNIKRGMGKFCPINVMQFL